MSPQRSRGRPTKAIVTCDKITKAALEIAAQQGYSKLTMSAVARALGVSPSALYNHVSGKEELLFIVEDAVMAQVDTAALEACLAGTIEPAEALTAWGSSYRDVLSRHCALIAHLGTMPTFGARGTVEMYELVVAVVRRAGVDEREAMDVVAVLESFIFGASFNVLIDAHNPHHIFDLGLRTLLAGLV
ncbi:TetR/AcrR family transcriptional regulator [Corynebacterium timonense]|uniref:DNA-binding transcriptional regulator, AcrR family n=1 Tax=Corynebacterium timonense TaxID=441500 RepID=A0A1H1UN39_9CORY|nr:TetR/AcrR family transcriptional regulator [Corynebacterium timonense]SDS73883.1 DNA-binding transcriptional regulator, AcrR family [Corynebacterium timonense]